MVATVVSDIIPILRTRNEAPPRYAQSQALPVASMSSPTYKEIQNNLSHYKLPIS